MSETVSSIVLYIYTEFRRIQIKQLFVRRQVKNKLTKKRKEKKEELNFRIKSFTSPFFGLKFYFGRGR